MSEFVVYRTLGNGRCLVLDGTRVAGGKPDYRGNNYITSWVTKKTYGPVDELKSENVKLRELVRDFERYRFGDCQHCGYEEQCMARQTNCYKVHVDLLIRARELGLVVE